MQWNQPPHQDPNQIQDEIRVNDAKNMIKDKKDVYDACIRNGFFLPKFSSRIITYEFLKDVIHKTVWVPQRNEVVHHTNVQSPKREIVQDELRRVLQEGVQNAPEQLRPGILCLSRYLQARGADKEWLLTVIHQICQGNHPYFARNYRPPINHDQAAQFNDRNIQNVNGFYNQLPQTKSKAKRSVAINYLAKEQYERFKVSKIDEKIRKLNAKRQQMMNEREIQVAYPAGGLIPPNDANQQLNPGQQEPVQQNEQQNVNPVHDPNDQNQQQQHDIAMADAGQPQNDGHEEAKENPNANNRRHRSPMRQRAAAQRALDAIAPNQQQIMLENADAAQ